MREIDRALAEIADIRSQLAAGTMFRGFGPAVMVVTAGLALAAAAAQSLWPGMLADGPGAYFGCWVVTALVAGALIVAEMKARSQRLHGGLADAMIVTAAERFLPAGAAGAAIAAVLFEFAPEAQWMLPGLWQILVALGLFASLRTLPRAISLAGAWYFAAGIAVLILASGDHTLSPWAMGIPFAVGQALIAAILYVAGGECDDRA